MAVAVALTVGVTVDVGEGCATVGDGLGVGCRSALPLQAMNNRASSGRSRAMEGSGARTAGPLSDGPRLECALAGGGCQRDSRMLGFALSGLALVRYARARMTRRRRARAVVTARRLVAARPW